MPMAREQNLKNLRTEKVGITILREGVPGFVVPSQDQKRALYDMCDIDYRRYSQSIDGVILQVDSFENVRRRDDFLFVEVKTTASKTVKELPFGVFFGFTENEESLFKSQSNYRLCIVHTGMRKHCLLTYTEYEALIQNKRIQYQVNFKTR